MRYLKLTSPDVNNGIGCRVTVWVAGCTHKCKGCQNPSTWDYNQGEKTIIDKLLLELGHPYIQGVTFSGGDPLAQDEVSLIELYALIKKVKEAYPEKDIWLYTGDVYEEAIGNTFKRQIIEMCDVIVEGPFKEELRDVSIAFRGSSNQRVLIINENYPYKVTDGIKISNLKGVK